MNIYNNDTNNLQVPLDIHRNDWQWLCIMCMVVMVANCYFELGTKLKYFQYAVTVAWNYEEIKWNPERVSNIAPFIDKWNLEEIN